METSRADQRARPRYFPAFYAFKDVFMDKKPGGVDAALHHYAADSPTQLSTTWMFWVPANMLVFTSPPHLRVVLVSAVGTAYIAVLSLVTHWLE